MAEVSDLVVKYAKELKHFSKRDLIRLVLEQAKEIAGYRQQFGIKRAK